tara:strand:+ start:355 stop:513 length:159 start_codon:yes stop_codon:yes gene_type:complete
MPVDIKELPNIKYEKYDIKKKQIVKDKDIKNNKEYNYLDDILDTNFLKNYFK